MLCVSVLRIFTKFLLFRSFGNFLFIYFSPSFFHQAPETNPNHHITMTKYNSSRILRYLIIAISFWKRFADKYNKYNLGYLWYIFAPNTNYVYRINNYWHPNVSQTLCPSTSSQLDELRYNLNYQWSGVFIFKAKINRN